MAEFIEVMNQKKRMCDRFKDCEKCPIGKLSGELHLSCEYAFDNIPQEAEKIIMKWAKEHPIKTNADKFKEVFGFEPLVGDTVCTLTICTTATPCNVCPNNGFWNREYKAPKGE